MDNENSLDRTGNLFILSKISTSGASLYEIILSLRECRGSEILLFIREIGEKHLNKFLLLLIYVLFNLQKKDAI